MAEFTDDPFALLALLISTVIMLVYVFRIIRPHGLAWKLLARFVSQPRVADWIIERSKATPYSHIGARGDDVSEVYMYRWWLFNAYQKDETTGREGPPKWPWLPSIRVHHIVRPDDDDHMHDHPWDARTIVLRNWYAEERPLSALTTDEMTFDIVDINNYPGELEPRATTDSLPGSTRAVRYGEYHRISAVAPGGVFTLWFTWKYQGTWGFWVDGVKVPYRKYLKLDQ